MTTDWPTGVRCDMTGDSVRLKACARCARKMTSGVWSLHGASCDELTLCSLDPT